VKINNPRSYISNLDELPFPAYHLINLENYFILKKKGFVGRPVWRYPGSERSASIITSRGCPFNCIFCSVHLHMGYRWRFNSSEYVLKHLELLTSKYKIKHIHFEDDNLTLSAQRFQEIIDGLLQRKIKITWDTTNGVRADTITKELLKKSWDSGCVYIVLGAESGDPRVLSEIIKKELDLTKVIKVAGWCKEVGLDTTVFFIIGFPGETVADMKKTVQFALKLMKDYEVWPTIFLATPLIGTELYNICLKKGYLRKELSGDNLAMSVGGGGEESLIKTEDFGPEEISAVIKQFMVGYKIVFLHHLLLFLLKNPSAWPEFIKKLCLFKREISLSSAIIKVLSFKNCLRRKFYFDKE
jgi:magnesium-protoporphyrin IX monomethyl ester (oxidative) cyclase